MGIEPTYQAWEARVLPLNYARIGCSRQASARRRFWQSETVESRAGSWAIAQQRRESLVFRLFRIPARLSPRNDPHPSTLSCPQDPHYAGGAESWRNSHGHAVDGITNPYVTTKPPRPMLHNPSSDPPAALCLSSRISPVSSGLAVIATPTGSWPVSPVSCRPSAVCTSLASGQQSTLTDVRLYLPEVWCNDAKPLRKGRHSQG